MTRFGKNWNQGLRFFGVLTNNWSNTGLVFHKDQTYRLSPTDKENVHWVFNYFNAVNNGIYENIGIKSVKDVKVADWSDGYTDVIRNENGDVIDAIKKYKSFTTTIDKNIYNNWVSSCKYDLKPGSK
jgi:hypothetical protein